MSIIKLQNSYHEGKRKNLVFATKFIDLIKQRCFKQVSNIFLTVNVQLMNCTVLQVINPRSVILNSYATKVYFLKYLPSFTSLEFTEGSVHTIALLRKLDFIVDINLTVTCTFWNVFKYRKLLYSVLNQNTILRMKVTDILVYILYIYIYVKDGNVKIGSYM